MITFITGNEAKVEQLSRYLAHPVAHKKLDLDEIQSLDIKKVVEHKARAAFQHIHGPVLVEDASLTINALGLLPGPLIKWFLAELGTAGLCQLLDNYKDRTAVSKVCFGYFDGHEVSYFEGAISGRIAPHPKGDGGFGWSPIFIPDGNDKTWGEMSREEQKSTSMRRIALTKLETFLNNL